MIDIRPMTKDDLEIVADIFVEVFNENGEKWTKESGLCHLTNAYVEESSFVAAEDNKLIGFIIFGVVLHEEAVEVYVDSLGVAADYRNMGVARQLWDRMLTEMSKHKIKRIRLLAKKDSVAYGWYKRMGFVENDWVEMCKIVNNRNKS